MKIVHLSPQVFQPGSMGGGERYVVELVRAQQARGSMATLIMVRNYRDFYRCELDEHGATPIGRLSIRELHQELRSAEVVHVHQWRSHAFDLGCLAAFGPGPKLVLTDHGGGFRAVGRAFRSLSLPLVDTFAVVSQYSAKDLGCRPAKTHVVGGGGDHVLRTQAAIPRRFRKSDFLYVGRIVPHKGLHFLLSAIPRTASLKVSGEFRDSEYEDYVRSLAANKQVEFLGPVPGHDMAALYRSARVTIVPTMRAVDGHPVARPELLGLVALESLACGTPVIGADVGGLSESLDQHGQAIFQANDQKSLRHACSVVLEEGSKESVVLSPPTWDGVAQKCSEAYS